VPFEASKDFTQCLTRPQAAQEAKMSQLPEFIELNTRIAAAKEKVGEHTREALEQTFPVFDFDSLFA
jgi:hypothetical protein